MKKTSESRQIVRSEIHNLFFVPMSDGFVFSVDEQNLWDDGVMDFVDGLSVGHFRVYLYNTGEVIVAGWGFVNPQEEGFPNE